MELFTAFRLAAWARAVAISSDCAMVDGAPTRKVMPKTDTASFGSGSGTSIGSLTS
jgi:hypothetical protein